MGYAILGLVFLSCVRKQAEKAMEIKPIAAFFFVHGFCFSPCLQVTALSSCPEFFSDRVLMTRKENKTWKC